MATFVSAMAESSGKVKITFWYFGDEFFLESLQSRADTIADKVEVEFVMVPYDQYETKLRIACNSGQAPDMFMVDGVYTANYAMMGMLLPLDEYWSADDFADYVQTSQDKCSYNGIRYAMSQQESSCVLFYNKDMFEAAGITDVPATFADAWTQDQLIEVAKKLTITDASGQITQYGLQPGMATPDIVGEGATFTFLNWFWNNGGEVTDPELKTAVGYFDSEVSIAAIESYAKLFNEYKVSPLQTITQGFETGKIAMLIHNASMIGGFEKNFPDLHFGVMPLPKGTDHQYGTSGGWNYGISSQTKHPAEAFMMLDAVCGKEGHLAHCERTGAMPSRYSTIEALPKLSSDPRLMIAVDLIKAGRARPITPAYAEISPIMIEAVNAVCYGADAAQTAQTAAKKMDRILAKYTSF